MNLAFCHTSSTEIPYTKFNIGGTSTAIMSEVAPTALVEAADWAYLTASGFMLDTGIDVMNPIFTVETLTNGSSRSYSGILQPYTKSSDGTYAIVTSKSKALINTGVQTASWPVLSSASDGTVKANQSFSVPEGGDAVYFAPLFQNFPSPPTQSTTNKNLYVNIYLSMDGTGPYKIVFNAAIVGGPMSLMMTDPTTKATVSTLQSPMGDNGWSLTQPGGGANDFVLEYSGTSTQYLPALTIRKVSTESSFSYFKVTSCTGFGIQVISTLWSLQFQSYAPTNSVSCSQSLVSATPLGFALIIGIPVLVVLIAGLTLGFEWKKLKAKNAASGPSDIAKSK